MILQSLLSKEAELAKEGSKLSTSSKQSPKTTDLTRGFDVPSSEVDPSSSSNMPSGTESRPRIESDSVPSFSGSARRTFKIGKLLIPFVLSCLEGRVRAD